MLEPGRYRSLIQARAQAQTAPDSTDAQLQLARASRQAILILKNVGHNGGGDMLAQETSAAYRRALELSPGQPELYSEFARWLMATGGWIQLMVDGTCPVELCELIDQGLDKFPADPELKKIDEEIRMLQENAALNATLNAASTADSGAQVSPLPVRTGSPPTPLTTPFGATSTSAVPTQPTPTTDLAAATRPESNAPGSNGVCPAGLIPLAMMLSALGAGHFHRARPIGK